ncbi:hypothetical protein TH63_08315 [Rufibacter radiotolerans]|uniref:Uncharacterized protein n=1 Tax=Rufibacter radiotolerans TaxID=1379910 RepID=A0A0H4W5H0_9BACT|nr:hypothetical protein TH63_08315 [Rufibacter radiotolerans]
MQAKAQKVLIEPYVIGLVEDFKGRQWVKDSPKEAIYIDKFHQTEAKLLQYLDSLVTTYNKKTYDKIQLSLENWEQKNCYYCHEFKLMYSDRLADKVNDAYSFKWEKEVNDANQKVYVGTLKTNAFKTPQEKASFLAGAYTRYGLREADTYTYRFSGTRSKFKAILRELEALRCDILEVKLDDETSPIQQISFTPSEQLRPYLEKQDKLRRDILTKKEAVKREKGNVKEIFDNVQEQ